TALACPRGRHEDSIRGESHRQVALGRDHEAALVHPSPDSADLTPAVTFRVRLFKIAGGRKVPGHRKALLPRVSRTGRTSPTLGLQASDPPYEGNCQFLQSGVAGSA